MKTYTANGLESTIDVHKAHLALDAIEQLDRFMSDFNSFLDYDLRNALYDLRVGVWASIEIAEKSLREGRVTERY